MTINIVVVNEITREILGRFNTVKAAEDWIAERAKVDPSGVYAGNYGIDAPEEILNGRRVVTPDTGEVK